MGGIAFKRFLQSYLDRRLFDRLVSETADSQTEQLAYHEFRVIFEAIQKHLHRSSTHELSKARH